MDTLISNTTVVPMADGLPVLERAFVLISNGRISYVGPDRPSPFLGEEIDGRGKVVLPGLINCHTHMPMTVLRGYADDYDLQTWLNDHILPVESRLDARCVRYSTLLGLAEAIASGTTSFSDMYNFCEEILKAVDESGIKANIARGTTLFADDFDFETHPACSELRSIHRDWHGHDNGRIQIEASVHAEYTSNAKLWDALARYASDNHLGMHVHLSETKKEHENCVAKYGLTPAQVLDRSGIWNTRAMAAHCVWVSDEDIALLKKRGVSVIHNPISNLKLANGVAPVPKMLNHGVNVALGTDSAASNNNLDMFEEIRAAALIHKGVSGDPLAISAHQALSLATVNGARAQGRQGECGRIEPGMDADLILVDFDQPHLFPCHDVESNLGYAARGGDVFLTMVRGRVLYKNGEFLTIDLDRVYNELKDYALPRLFS